MINSLQFTARPPIPSCWRPSFIIRSRNVSGWLKRPQPNRSAAQKPCWNTSGRVSPCSEQVRRWTPKHPLIAIPFASLLGFLFPVCECAIIPVVRRLIQKGMPVHVGIVFLLAGPVVNPVVLTSTYIAFQRQPDLAMYRGLGAVVVAVLAGLVMWAITRGNPLRIGVERVIRHEATHYEMVRGQLELRTVDGYDMLVLKAAKIEQVKAPKDPYVYYNYGNAGE
ncbi:permease [Brevibacillus sp. H7]|uniref:permease n=1 Tax=Brevibacillus sp. H7 TaxID=3349138 RepID=UPI00380BDAD9